jgi:hypothetical protein
MPDITIRHELDCDEETYFEKCFFDADYNRRLFLEELKFPGLKVIAQKDEGGVVRRTLEVDPPVTGLPGPVKKVVGDSFTYTEDGTYDRATKRYTFTITTKALGEKARTSGEVWCEKLGDKKVARVAKVQVQVKVFMVGSLIEDRIMTDMKASYAKAAEFTNRFVREKGY